MTGREILIQKGVSFENDWIDACPSDYGLKNDDTVCNSNGDGCEYCIKSALDHEYE